MTKAELDQLFTRFKQIKVLVIGDVMLDSYWWGNVSRISPEAPVPVVSVVKKESRAGGAGNVALNLLALGATPILCGVTGDDNDGRELRDLISEAGMETSGLIESSSRKTTVKTRVIGNNHQLMRIDSETEEDIDDRLEHNMLGRIRELVAQATPGVIIIQDYNKGLLTSQLIKEVIALGKEKGIPVAVDPKKKNFHAYSGADLFKPNLKELVEGMKTDVDRENREQLIRTACEAREKLDAGMLLLTLSESGILFCTEDGADILPAHIRNIADVSGAGDTVISVSALCLALGMNAQDTAWLSNLAGGLVCEHVGVIPVNRDELLNEASKLIS